MRRGIRRVALLLCVAGNLAWAFQAPAGNPPVFERDVLPILKVNTCLGCHGSSLKIKDLNLSTFEGVRKGSETGAVVVPGKPDESRLFQMVHDGKMPPGGKIRLSDGDLAVIRSWIESGAKSESQPAEAAEALTQDDIIPILYLRCTPCHGLRRQEAGLDLRTKAAILKGGKSGPAMIPGKPGESLIVAKIKAGEMPPKIAAGRQGQAGGAAGAGQDRPLDRGRRARSGRAARPGIDRPGSASLGQRPAVVGLSTSASYGRAASTSWRPRAQSD